MPPHNPYPERAIASFLLVGAMGAVLFAVDPPVRTKSTSTEMPSVAQDAGQEPTGRGGQSQRGPLSTPTPSVAPSGSTPRRTSVFSEAAIVHRAETSATITSAAPEPTQAGSSPDPVLTPTPTPTPEPTPGILQCAVPVTVLDDLLCQNG